MTDRLGDRIHRNDKVNTSRVIYLLTIGFPTMFSFFHNTKISRQNKTKMKVIWFWRNQKFWQKLRGLLNFSL